MVWKYECVLFYAFKFFGKSLMKRKWLQSPLDYTLHFYFGPLKRILKAMHNNVQFSRLCEGRKISFLLHQKFACYRHAWFAVNNFEISICFPPIRQDFDDIQYIYIYSHASCMRIKCQHISNKGFVVPKIQIYSQMFITRLNDHREQCYNTTMSSG